MPRLTLADIADLRAYESEREEFRRRIIEVKRVRRVAVGPHVSLTFENAETMRFQVQEMARAEKILSGARIQEELDVYNPLIPEPGHLSATLFVELTNESDLRTWLPKLVGIERSVVLRFGADENSAGKDGAAPADEVRCVIETAHEAQLTREDITASVHYIAFALTGEQVDRFAREQVALAVNHPAYREAAVLPEPTRAALLEDLRNGG